MLAEAASRVRVAEVAVRVERRQEGVVDDVAVEMAVEEVVAAALLRSPKD